MLNGFQTKDYPFLHFISEGNSIPINAAEEMLLLAKPSELTDNRGSRADYKERVFLKDEFYSDYPQSIKDFLDSILSKDFIEYCKHKFDVDIIGSNLRIELACDVDGFFQVPHTDVGDKRITWLTYLGTVDENNDVGTDLYEDENTYALSAPWGFNNGLIFKPGPNSYHGFSKGKKINGNRKVLIINFVDNWNDRHELYKDEAVK